MSYYGGRWREMASRVTIHRLGFSVHRGLSLLRFKGKNQICLNFEVFVFSALEVLVLVRLWQCPTSCGEEPPARADVTDDVTLSMHAHQPPSMETNRGKGVEPSSQGHLDEDGFTVVERRKWRPKTGNGAKGKNPNGMTADITHGGDKNSMGPVDKGIYTSACKGDIACTSACNETTTCTSTYMNGAASSNATTASKTNRSVDVGTTPNQSACVEVGASVSARVGSASVGASVGASIGASVVSARDQIRGKVTGGPDSDVIGEEAPTDLGAFLEIFLVNMDQSGIGSSDQHGKQKEGAITRPKYPF
ncbi:hypothetical protein L6452_31022 [Arctium lappa]|uniref:Uncharacterized protein n=1 Tax=Arctium lappa TaxID=4217 RepID=A0ACB8ZIW5_ARCLA|nr:hypothetical protein L6452_31022 [Arctium lappa]